MASPLHLVDNNDLMLWKSGFGTHHFATHLRGDLNGDFKIDGVDFLSWQRNLGSEMAGAPANAVVPEPTGLSLAAFAFGLASLAKWLQGTRC